jgi:hypothetical protein
MNDLLNRTIEAHGGLDRWNNVNHISARIKVGGVTWEIKKQPGILNDIYVTVDTKRQYSSHYPFIDSDWHTNFQADRVAIEDGDGKVIEELLHPRMSFHDHSIETPWTRLQLAYFAGYAMWTYLNAPFNFADPEYKVDELDPWSEEGQTFRRLRVTYPESIATHGPVQTFYIDESGLIRRHDYDVEVFGGSGAVHYLSDYIEVEGIKIATKRRVYLRSKDNTAVVPVPLLVSVDLSEIKLNLYGNPDYNINEDIYSRDEKLSFDDEGNVTEIDNEETENPLPGDDLDIPGAELDDDEEGIGEEDEENNYYSLGGDNHDDIVEAKN